MFWAWHGASGVDDSGGTRYSFAGAGGLPCGLLAKLERSFVFPLCIGVLSLCWGSLMQTWAAIILLLDSNWELNNHK